MANIIEITGCGDCPMYSVLSGGIEICGHPDIEDCTDLSICPLTKESITIKLKDDDIKEYKFDIQLSDFEADVLNKTMERLAKKTMEGIPKKEP